MALNKPGTISITSIQRFLRQARRRGGQNSCAVTTLDHMEELTARVEAVLRELGLKVLSPQEADGAADLIARIPTADGWVGAVVQIKDRAEPLGPAEVQRWQARAPRPSILAVRRVTPDQGRRYRAAGVHYVDSGGNAYLDYPGYHVHIEGRRPTISRQRSGRTKPPSTNAAGLRVVFALLVEPHLANRPYEQLAQLAMVSKGSVTSTMMDLRHRGHLFGDRGNRRLVDVAHLTHDWVDGYARDLMPRLKTLELHGPSPEWWLQSWRAARDGVLGGGPALVHYGARLRPDRTVVYGPPPWKELRRQARLSREGEPNVVLRQQFWSPDLRPNDCFVPPLLGYADALASGDPRETEAAQGLWRDRNWRFDDA